MPDGKSDEKFDPIAFLILLGVMAYVSFAIVAVDWLLGTR